jgi:hypothetical protein
MSEHTFEVVTTVFAVIVGVAVERFLTEFPLKKDVAFAHPEPQQARTGARLTLSGQLRERPSKIYWFSYVFSLMAIVTLVLRFIMGSDFHLRHAYEKAASKPDIDNFIIDICFLMFFGAFIVGAALAEQIYRFALWLALFSGVAVVWSGIALLRGTQRGLIWWWLIINGIQLVLGLVVMLLCLRWEKRKSYNSMICGLLVLAAWYVVIFPFDLEHILLAK